MMPAAPESTSSLYSQFDIDSGHSGFYLATPKKGSEPFRGGRPKGRSCPAHLHQVRIASSSACQASRTQFFRPGHFLMSARTFNSESTSVSRSISINSRRVLILAVASRIVSPCTSPPSMDAEALKIAHPSVVNAYSVIVALDSRSSTVTLSPQSLFTRVPIFEGASR